MPVLVIPPRGLINVIPATGSPLTLRPDAPRSLLFQIPIAKIVDSRSKLDGVALVAIYHEDAEGNAAGDGGSLERDVEATLGVTGPDADTLAEKWDAPRRWQAA